MIHLYPLPESLSAKAITLNNLWHFLHIVNNIFISLFPNLLTPDVVYQLPTMEQENLVVLPACPHHFLFHTGIAGIEQRLLSRYSASTYVFFTSEPRGKFRSPFLSCVTFWILAFSPDSFSVSQLLMLLQQTHRTPPRPVSHAV